MKDLTNGNIEQLLEDITQIKSVISRNKPLLRQIYLPASIRMVALILGVGIIAFSGVFHFLITSFGSWVAVPGLYKIIVFAAMSLVFIFALALKAVNILRTVSKVDKKITMLKVYREALSFRVGNVNIPVLALIVFFSVYVSIHISPYYIIPAFSIGMGLIANFIGSITELKQFIIMGYWQLIAGVAVIVFTVSPMVAVSVTIGCSYILFGVVSYFRSDGEGEV
jgi:MFS family permease